VCAGDRNQEQSDGNIQFVSSLVKMTTAITTTTGIRCAARIIGTTCGIPL